MSFHNWLTWFSSLHWKFMWFPLLILVRPFTDLAFDKKIIFSLTPLHIIGGGVPVFILFLLLTKELQAGSKTRSPFNNFFRLWCILLVINATLIWISEPSVSRLSWAFKITLPFYLFLFLRYFVVSEKNLEGILQTMLYSIYISFVFFLYEVIVSPFRVQYSRGIERITGGYADVASLGLYINIGMVIVCFFWMDKARKNKKKKMMNLSLLIFIGVCLIGLFRINHAASYGIFFAIIVLFLFYISKLKMKMVLAGAGVLFFFAFVLIAGGMLEEKIDENLSPIFSKDISIIKGEKDIEGLFHGRVGRWQNHWEFFKTEISFFEQFFGLIGMKEPFMVGPGTHNDYLRIIYTTGYLGFFAYIMFLIHFYIKSRSHNPAHSFLARGILVIILLQSISLTPTIYNVINYIFIPLVCFVGLRNKMKKNDVRK